MDREFQLATKKKIELTMDKIIGWLYSIHLAKARKFEDKLMDMDNQGEKNIRDIGEYRKFCIIWPRRCTTTKILLGWAG